MSHVKVLIAWILLAVAVSLLRFGVVLQSDALFYDALASDLLAHGGAWSDWKFSAAPGFLPDMGLYFLGYLLFSEAPARLLFVSAVQAFALAALAVALVRRLTPPGRPAPHAGVVLAVAFATLVSAQSGMWLYFHTTNNHFGSVLFGLLGTMLALRLWRQPAWPGALALLLLAGVAGASSRLFVLTFTLPCLILAGAALLAGRDDGGRTRLRGAPLRLIAVLAAGQALALLLERLLIKHLPVEGRVPLSFDAVSASLAVFLDATGAAFAPDNRATLLLSLAVSACLLYLLFSLLRHLRRHGLRLAPPCAAPHERDLAAVGALLCVSLPVTLAGSVLSASLVDAAGYRYLAFPLVLAVLLALTLATRQARRPRVAQTAWAVAALLIAANALQLARSATQRVDPSAAVAECVAGVGAAGFPLRAGIADYWNARAVSLQLPGQHPILATIHDLTPLFWVSTLGPLTDPVRYPEYHYNFAILRNPGHDVQFHYTPDMVGRRLPPPDRIVACPDGATQLWLYDGAALHQTMQAAIGAFLQQRKNNP